MADKKDVRFASVGSDPRFKRSRVQERKVKIDSRFAAALTDDRFGVARARVDKYGRREKPQSRKSELAPFYEVDEDEAKLRALEARARGEDQEDVASSDDDSVEEEDSSSSSSEDDDLDDEGPAQAWDASLPAAYQEASPDFPSTCRLAFLDMDWTRARAKDVLAIAQSLCPGGGRCKTVQVYVSQYGLKAIEEEKRFGPTRDLFTGTTAAAAAKDDDDFNDDDANDDDANDKEAADDEEDEDENEEEDEVAPKAQEEITSGFDPEALRLYEMSKLRRYFAVATFDSPRTAERVYSNDGVELEATSTPLSLAIIEDSEIFDSSRLRDEADYDTSLRSYEPPAAYCLAARQRTKVECTWDADEPERKTALEKAFAVDADDANLQAYLADSDDDDDDEQLKNKEDARRRLRAQLGLALSDDDDEADEGEDHRDDDDDEVGDDDDDDDVLDLVDSKSTKKTTKKKKKKDLLVEMVTPGTDGLTDSLSYAADDEAPSRERRKKQRLAEKETKKATVTNDDFFVAADEGIAEAESDSDDDRDYDVKKILKAERLASKPKLRGKRKRQRDALLAETRKSGFAFDAQDSRFKAVLEGQDDEYGVDPTNADFKETPNMKTLLLEQTKRRREKRLAAQTPATTTSKTTKKTHNAARKKKNNGTLDDDDEEKHQLDAILKKFPSLKKRT